MKALSIAATGMNAQQLNLEVIANNIANINTTGYKRARAEFSDLLYQAERSQGVPNRAGQAIIPEGANVGLGVQTSAVRNLHLQGSMVSTGNDLDVALIGKGWFQVQMPDGTTNYTRAGAFNTNDTGQLVTIDGYTVVPGITVPANTSKVTITTSGEVLANIGNATIPTNIGQLTIANFVNEAGLEPQGDNLFKQTPASGAPVVGVPGDAGFATIKQKYLEASNVDPVKEITDLISAQRAYEMNSKVIQAADEMAGTVSKNLR
ncbi:flagellar basal-body rod protein FlgG [Rhizobium rhizosphaerae]|uniref:Flagellar basal-body rod protein FlgG n=1 Tax=Xaviernesmea rhizosphaerae TaxID=1672749 RepID=A0A1Q9AIJ2_9HYPH|nr:flagellar basal-body rod protein FlgG [Xaviernesmea rhizosphaerae]OLP55075.1 flagellar basal-body rod protein FlgG [Xaviernesmea rhizosphaerae]OQP83546.1 flagellar basal-body rod protein FlgG [Xaviernesmea rhizosphaerae]